MRFFMNGLQPQSDPYAQKRLLTSHVRNDDGRRRLWINFKVYSAVEPMTSLPDYNKTNEAD